MVACLSPRARKRLAGRGGAKGGEGRGEGRREGRSGEERREEERKVALRPLTAGVVDPRLLEGVE